jgi:hypothetical protein
LDFYGFFIYAALCAQTQIKKNLESVALQRFQDFSCGSLFGVMKITGI